MWSSPYEIHNESYLLALMFGCAADESQKDYDDFVRGVPPFVRMSAPNQPSSLQTYRVISPENGSYAPDLGLGSP